MRARELEREEEERVHERWCVVDHVLHTRYDPWCVCLCVCVFACLARIVTKIIIDRHDAYVSVE